MGLFSVDVKLANPAAPERAEQISLIVDTGATLSWVPRDVLQRIGVRSTTRLEFELADGRGIEREVGAALFTIDGKSLPIPVAFGEAGEQSVLGAAALESLGFVVDPIGRKLVPRKLLAL